MGQSKGSTACAPPLSEKAFQGMVRELAGYCGWLCYCTYDSRKSPAGYPDLTMIRGAELIFCELKTDRGELRPAQRQWLAALREAGCECHVWRPQAWPEIEQRLMRSGAVRRTHPNGGE
jgi:hypothetical protein